MSGAGAVWIATNNLIPVLIPNMKTSILKNHFLAGLTVAGLTLAPHARANVEVFIEGGSASSGVLYQLATNILNGGTITVSGVNNSVVRTYSGTSTLPSLSGYGTITIDFNLNGAVGGLQNLTGQTTDTNILGSSIVPVLVDSATSPEAVGLNSTTAHLSALPTYVVPLVYAKNTNSTDTAAITDLTQRQAYTLETSSPEPTTYYGGTSTNVVYFVGRNNESAVRTEIDLAIYNTQPIVTWQTNSSGQPVQDPSLTDPGFSSSGAEVNTATVLTNSILEIAVQNIKKPLSPLSYEGVPYSVTNVINGSYPLWGYENYYFIKSGYTGQPTTSQLAVINALYNSVTNTSFQSLGNPVFTNYFIPNSSLQVFRYAGSDGGQIYPNN